MFCKFVDFASDDPVLAFWAVTGVQLWFLAYAKVILG